MSSVPAEPPVPACREVAEVQTGRAGRQTHSAAEADGETRTSDKLLNFLHSLSHPLTSAQCTAGAGTAKYRTVGTRVPSWRPTSAESLYGSGGITWQNSCGFLRRAVRGNNLKAEKQLRVPTGSSQALWVWPCAL